MTRDYSSNGRPCIVEYFDSFSRRNVTSPATVNSVRFSFNGEQLVEVTLPSHKVVTVPSEFVGYPHK